MRPGARPAVSNVAGPCWLVCAGVPPPSRSRGAARVCACAVMGDSGSRVAGFGEEQADAPGAAGTGQFDRAPEDNYLTRGHDGCTAG